MKKVLLASLAGLALTTGSALAADLGQPLYKAPPPPAAPEISWTGCYVDGGVGYGFWNQNHRTETDPGLVTLTPTVSTGGNGWLGRVGGGCDYQFASSFVIGAFGDYDFADLRGTFQDPFTGDIGNEKETGSWAVGGRVGYLITPSLLSYVDGGYTQARFDHINLSTAIGNSFPSHTYSGWFIGGGYEYSLNWLSFIPISGLFWRTEYRFQQYQSADLPLLFDGVQTGLASHMQKDEQTITSGLVWRFNFGGQFAGGPFAPQQ
jgi:outer membrane immunogenic protein